MPVADRYDEYHLSSVTDRCNDRYEDDFLRAMLASAADSDDMDNDLFIDFTHTITIGYHNEKYYLILVIGGVDFLWASPTTTQSRPEELLQEFVTLTCIKIRRIRLY